MNKFLKFINKDDILSQFLLISIFIILIMTILDISFFYGILRCNFAFVTILYQLTMKSFIVIPLIYIIFVQHKKINTIEKYIDKDEDRD